MKKYYFSALVTMLIMGLSKRPAKALPTMIRLGYPTCASCHISPQGGGLLNVYGRGIDEAQSLRAGEYKPSDNKVTKWLGWQGRITQDVRAILQEQLSTSTNQPVIGMLRARFIYRNATELGKGIRLSAIINGENDSLRRPALSYEPAIKPHQTYITSALLSYRLRDTVEFAAGRDQLPSGVNVPDLTMFIRSRNRMGYYDSPTQLKLFWRGKRYQISPYLFAPSGIEQPGIGESGGGSLAEFDVLGKGTTVAGMNLLRGSSLKAERTLLGPYMRLGFGSWGVLAEHDITQRKLAVASFQQNPTYAQLFWAAREWLVVSVIGERLEVQRPFSERLVVGKVEVTSRFSNHITLGINTRLQRNLMTRQLAPSFAVQLALKSVP